MPLTKSTFLSEGIRNMAGSVFCFSLMNVFVKLMPNIPAMELVFFRCAISSLICIWGIRKAKVDWLGNNHLLLFLRGASGTFALFCFFMTVQNLPLGTAITVSYLSPIFTTILAIFLLSEKVRILQWVFFAVSFAGIFVIRGFDPRISSFYLLTGILSAIFSGLAYNLVRTMRGTENTLVVVLHFQIVGVAAGLISTIFNWQMPTGIEWLYILVIGIAAQMGQVYLTRALQAERAANVSIVSYTGIIYALIFGWLVFGEMYSPEMIAGILLVLFGVILGIIYNRRGAEIVVEETLG